MKRIFALLAVLLALLLLCACANTESAKEQMILQELKTMKTDKLVIRLYHAAASNGYLSEAGKVLETYDVYVVKNNDQEVYTRIAEGEPSVTWNRYEKKDGQWLLRQQTNTAPAENTVKYIGQYTVEDPGLQRPVDRQPERSAENVRRIREFLQNLYVDDPTVLRAYICGAEYGEEDPYAVVLREIEPGNITYWHYSFLMDEEQIYDGSSMMTVMEEICAYISLAQDVVVLKKDS